MLNALLRSASGTFVSLAFLLCAFSAQAAESFTIGFLELKGDPRYSSRATYARYLGQPQGRPIAGAKSALQETRFHGAAAGVSFDVKRMRKRNAEGLLETIEKAHAEGISFFVADLPADVLSEVAAALKDRDIMLFNASAPENALRNEQCQANLMHVMPSHAMQTDALAQYLAANKWREVLLLQGPDDPDLALGESFLRSAKRYGLKLSDTRDFIYSNDPRQREQNNIKLLTKGDYDVVMVADTDGEFAREVPYQTLLPRLTIGTEGLSALAWHWAWERHGAPQLEKRFEEEAKRPMGSRDWAAWASVKIIAESVQRTKSADFGVLKSYIHSDELVVDTFKGNPAGFRPWNNQLRQTLLLGTHNWVVERAPLRGFLHKDNTLDSLGFDEKDSSCRF